MENNVKGLKKQLVAAIAMVLVAAIALGSSTFAWFVNNNSVTAEGMTVNALADTSIVIKGTEDTAFGSVGHNDLNVTNLKPSTSYDGLIFGRLNMAAVSVDSAGAANATWSGDNKSFQSTDLTTVDGAGTYYATTSYKIKSVGEAANVYVEDIELGGSVAEIDKAIRVSVTINGKTLVYNAGKGELIQNEGVGKFADNAWSLADITYTKAESLANYDENKVFELTNADTEYPVTINIWYEGQDENCCTDNVSANDKTITIKFTKVTSDSAQN